MDRPRCCDIRIRHARKSRIGLLESAGITWQIRLASAMQLALPMKFVRVLLPLVFPTLAFACLGPEDPVLQCGGVLRINIPHDGNPPANIEVQWDGSLVYSDCRGVENGRVFVERAGDYIIVEDGSIGFGVPPVFSLALSDEGDCTGDVVPLIADRERSVPKAAIDEQRGFCSSACLTIALDSSAKEAECQACLSNGGTWQPEAITCSDDCAIQDIACNRNTCPSAQ